MDSNAQISNISSYQIVPINDKGGCITLGESNGEMAIVVDDRQQRHGRRILYQNAVDAFVARSLGFQYNQDVE